ncbi:MAG: glutamine--tRNA ligase [Clostridiales bacterium]|nr:glutamine--tRNA ligase [Clostridiales bacterium]
MDLDKITPSNFIEDIIINDLKSGKVKSVVMRFPPEPNGRLHIGHAKAACFNFSTSKKFGGICNLRFDDTNPVKEDADFCDQILYDINWLGFTPAGVYYASDYFEYMRDCAVTLIKKGLAYVDESTPDEIRLMRGTLTEAGKNSPFRNRSVKENLLLFDKMQSGSVKDGGMVLRAKIDMASPNMNMRDPVVYRVLHTPHHRTGDKWCMYPMYDFAHPLEDAVEGITHSCCTMEFEDHRPLYDWFIDNCDTEHKPRQIEFARLSLTDTVMSKRYLKQLVDTNVVDGWDDPRMPTLSGLRRRGVPSHAIVAFCNEVGLAKSVGTVDAAQFNDCVRDELNAVAKRYMVVPDPVELDIVNLENGYKEDIEVTEGGEYVVPHPTPIDPPTSTTPVVTRNIRLTPRLYINREDFMPDPPKGYHRLVPGGLARLKNSFIVRCVGYDTDDSGKVVKIYCEKTDEVKAKGVIQWVDRDSAEDIEIRNFSAIVPDGEGDFTERINRDSLVTGTAKAEAAVKDLKAGEGVQFFRIGYFARDSKIENAFNCVVELKSTFKIK